MHVLTASRPRLRARVGGVVVVVFVAGFVQMMLQLLLRFPPALPDGPDLLRGRHRSMHMLVQAVPYSFASIPHKGIVSPALPSRKT
jgi:hypothetical protein